MVAPRLGGDGDRAGPAARPPGLESARSARRVPVPAPPRARGGAAPRWPHLRDHAGGRRGRAGARELRLSSYLGLPDLPRARWHLELPAMRRLSLDEHGIPTREEAAFAGFQRELGEAAFDDGFALIDERSIFALSG